MLPGPEIAPHREEEELKIAPVAEPGQDAMVASPDGEPAGDAANPELDPAHLGHGVHAHGDDVGHGVHAHGDDGGGMHVGDAALPAPSRTGAGLGGLQIGDTRF
jgi:hypothetical protein